MFSGKDVINPGYPTQWALNPSAYQNVDSSQVDWAALAQQWIAMKEAAAMVTAPPPPSKPDAEEGEAPMEVENPDHAADSSDIPAGPEWNAASSTWTDNWNQWGWGWPAGTVDPKIASDPSIAMNPMMDGYSMPTDGNTAMPGQVDWAALAQQWIAMKEAAAMVTAPPPPSKPDAEEGEAPMEVENPDHAADSSDIPAGPEWNAASSTWTDNWNQWGWGWPAGTVDPKIASDPSIAMNPMMDGYSMPTDGNTAMPGYTTGTAQAPTFQHGYWTAAQNEQQTSSRSSSSSRSRTRRSKSKNRESKSSRTSSRTYRDKPPLIPPLIEPLVPAVDAAASSIDAAKRRQLPAWIREGLEKMEREKQKAIEKEQELKAKEEAEKEKKRLEEEELLRLKAEANYDGPPMMPAKSKFESDSETEEMEDVCRNNVKEESPVEPTEETREPSEEKELPPPLVKKSKEEIMQEVMLAVRRSLTEILLEVTDREIQMVSQEELARFNAQQASSLNAIKASKSKALTSIATGLGLGAYESDSGSEDSDSDAQEVSDQQLQDIIKRKRFEFERTAREIEAEVRRAELRENEPATPPTPKQRNSSVTPPPIIERETPEKIPERRSSTDRKNSVKSNDKVDAAVRKLETIYEEKVKKSSKHDRTPSPPKSKSNQKSNTPTLTSDSEEDSASVSSKSSEEIRESKSESKHAKKRKRSSSGEPRKKYKKSHKEEKSSRSKHDDYDSSSKSRRKKDDYDRHKRSSRDRHKDRYRDDSEEDRPRKRSKRSRSTSYESRSTKKRSPDRSRDRSLDRSRRRDKRSYDRDRSYDRSYDKYERSRDERRSHSRSRHRR